MRSELKEAIGRLHSSDYQKLMATEKQVKKNRRNGYLRRLTRWSGPSGAHVSRLVAVLAVLFAIAGATYVIVAGIYYYNKFSIIAVELDKHKSLVDNEIKRRANLLPNLLSISTEYRAHEKLLYEYVSEMRTYLNAQPGPEAVSRNAAVSEMRRPPANLKGPAPNEATPLSELMLSLLAISEQYPDLKATQSFEKLMSEWTETEDRIAAARITYIGAIRELNALCTTFPSNLYSKLFMVEPRDPFSFEGSGAAPLSSNDLFSAYLAGETALLVPADEGAAALRRQPQAAAYREVAGGADAELQADAQAEGVEVLPGEDSVSGPEDTEQ